VSLGRYRSGAPALHERGFALIAMLTLAALLTAFLISIGLNRSRAELSNDREDRNMTALRQAKAALIGYAASEQWQNTGGSTPFQPGAFPCPDLDNNGIAEDHEFPQNPCNQPQERLGRLPWKTIGSDDLRDASGERLWYAVSAKFLRNTPVYTNVINSDTQGQLTVTGTAASSGVVAVVFAPGTAVLGQTRDPTDPVGYNNPANYLEQFNIATSTYSPYSTPTYDAFYSTALPSDSFNDRMLVITQADLMAAVEPVVAANIERDVKPFITAYAAASQWSRFPFPARFDNPDPGTSGGGTTRSPMLYLGDVSKWNGLLPVSVVPVSAASNTSPIVITTSAPHMQLSGNVVWVAGVQGNTAANNRWTVTLIDATHFQLNGSTGSGSYTSGGTVTPSYPWSNWSVSKAGGSGLIDNDSCVAVSGPPGLQCTFRARDDTCGASTCILNLSFQLQADVGTNAGLTFATLPGVASISTTLDGGPSAFSAASIKGSLDNTGKGTVLYSATLPVSINCPPIPCSNHNVVVTVPDVVSSGLTLPSPVAWPASWFITNEWYRQTYYAVARDLLPGAGGSCGVGFPCLSVNNAPARFTSPYTAIVILAGRALNGVSRPTGNPKDYLEGENCNLTVGRDLDPGGPPFTCNLTTTDYLYENRPGQPTSINDRVVVVSP